MVLDWEKVSMAMVAHITRSSGYKILWRFFILLFSIHQSVMTANVTQTPSATLTLTINDISSSYSLQTLTSFTVDQCRTWTETGTALPLTWTLETRLIAFSQSILYETNDMSVYVDSMAQLRYNPAKLSLNRANLIDTLGLAFHLSMNATPYCGTVKLPTKILCNEGTAVVLNITKTSAESGNRMICGQRYSFSYQYSVDCVNQAYSPPSCRTKCVEIRNSTHCFTCDAHDGTRLCCPGGTQPECRIFDSGHGSVYAEEASTPIGAIIAIALLALFCVLFLILSVFIGRLYMKEKEKHRRVHESHPTYRAGWTSDGCSSDGHSSVIDHGQPVLPARSDQVYMVSRPDHGTGNESEPSFPPTTSVSPIAQMNMKESRNRQEHRVDLERERMSQIEETTDADRKTRDRRYTQVMKDPRGMDAAHLNALKLSISRAAEKRMNTENSSDPGTMF